MQWLKRYDIRFVQGGFPEALDDADAGHSLTQVWLRDSLGRATDFASLAAISDAFFPRLFLRRARLWSQAGEMLVTTHQTVYYKE